MSKKFSENCFNFLNLHQQLITRGFKNKTLAKSLNIYPSAYSNLINSVIRPISELHNKNIASDTAIKEIFSEKNNVSERKIRQNIKEHLNTLKGLLTETEEETNKTFEANMVSNFLKNTPTDSLHLIEGVYDCYYISTSGFKVKKEPFIIYLDKKNSYYKVKKGNNLGAAKYNGFAYISNGDLLTVHLQEEGTFIQDHFIIHFHLPLTYSYSINLLQGLGISEANNKMPIARKVILHKKHKTPDREKFLKMETKYFSDTYNILSEEEQEILAYFKSENCLIDYMNIPFPSYNTSDLSKEKQIRNNYSTHTL